MSKISDLAAIVEVRNHILTVQNLNRSRFLSKDDWKKLDEQRIALDKKFTQEILALDVDSIIENPLTLVKIGSDSYKPTSEDLETWKEVFEQARHDKDFTIFTHNAVEVSRYPSELIDEFRIVPSKEWEQKPQKGESPLSVLKTKSSNTISLDENQMDLPFDKKNESIKITASNEHEVSPVKAPTKSRKKKVDEKG